MSVTPIGWTHPQYTWKATLAPCRTTLACKLDTPTLAENTPATWRGMASQMLRSLERPRRLRGAWSPWQGRLIEAEAKRFWCTGNAEQTQCRAPGTRIAAGLGKVHDWVLLVPRTALLFCTAVASSSRTFSVSSQLMHASVILTPYWRPSLPSLGTFWLPKCSGQCATGA